ncbi:MAG: FtsL-like putative cell division protein [Flavobacterium sp.]
MKGGIYSLLKAKYLVDQGSMKNWRFILFLIFIAMLMIANSHNYEEKLYKISAMESEIKQLRGEFVDRRSELMKLKMESTVAAKMEARQVFPAAVPPQKIVVTKEEQKNFFKRLWE